jgi:hypothetical protein
MSDIKATRNGVKREFPIEVWDKMPADKYGWTKQAELPEEVKALRNVDNANLGNDAGKATETKEKANAPKKEKAPAKENPVKTTKEKANAPSEK